MLFPVLTMAQKTPTIKFLEKYSEEKGYTSVYITKYTFDFLEEIGDEEQTKAFREGVSSLNSIKVLQNDFNYNLENNPFYTELLPSLEKYEEILMYKENGQFVKIFIYKIDNKITEFVVLNYGSTENILVIMEGDNINIKQLSKLSGTMKIDGIEHIDEIDKEKGE
jgi:hypothetical protein